MCGSVALCYVGAISIYYSSRIFRVDQRNLPVHQTDLLGLASRIAFLSELDDVDQSHCTLAQSKLWMEVGTSILVRSSATDVLLLDVRGCHNVMEGQDAQFRHDWT